MPDVSNSWPQDSWPVEHISLANPMGPDQNDVPELLRRVASLIASHGEISISDIVFHQEINDHGMWPSVTVYFRKSDA